MFGIPIKLRRGGPRGTGVGGQDAGSGSRRRAVRLHSRRGGRFSSRRRARGGRGRPRVASRPLGQGGRGSTHIRDHMGRISIRRVPRSPGSRLLGASARNGRRPVGVMPQRAPRWSRGQLGSMRF